ncbi:Leucine-Rich Repeat And Immunoglobulin-Like Domain-Containing Nogo Receptor-Interacting Protein 1, partial [Manis pentadactyla]
KLLTKNQIFRRILNVSCSQALTLPSLVLHPVPRRLFNPETLILPPLFLFADSSALIQ